MFTLTSDEFDIFHGPWCAAKIMLVRKYINHPVNCWTERELQFAKLLEQAMERLETPIAA